MTKRACFFALMIAVGIAAPASAQSGYSRIEVCNKGTIELYVAALKFFPLNETAKAWVRVGVNQCERVHNESVSSGTLFGIGSINEGATVNLAFVVRDPDGTFRPYLGLTDEIPRGRSQSPRIVCIPFPGESGGTVNSGTVKEYLPPCADGVPVIPVSTSVYIQGDLRLTVEQRPQPRVTRDHE